MDGRLIIKCSKSGSGVVRLSKPVSMLDKLFMKADCQ